MSSKGSSLGCKGEGRRWDRIWAWDCFRMGSNTSVWKNLCRSDPVCVFRRLVNSFMPKMLILHLFPHTLDH